MQNLLAKGAAWLAQQHATHCADYVYYMTVNSVVRIPATRGRTTFEVDGGDGVLVQVEADDFIVRVADLVIDDIPSEPASGHRITVGEPGDGEVFEVMGIAGQPAWRFTDEFRLGYRIHTKHVDTQ